MSTSSDVLVRIDDRVRLMSTVLALTSITDLAHARRPHSAHAHARATRKHFASLRHHPAVASLETLIDHQAPMEAIVGYALSLDQADFTLGTTPRWAPAHWDRQLGDFYHAANLSHWWGHDTTVWEKSLTEARRMFAYVNMRAFLHPFVESGDAAFVLLPNISYPAEHEVGVRVGTDITCIVPPRAAWGDSPPWPFDEDPVHIYRASVGQFARLLLSDYLTQHTDKVAEASQTELPVSDMVRAQHPTWVEQFLALAVAGIVAMFLEDQISPAEARAFTLIESKVHGMAMLPGVISVLRRYVNDMQAGKYSSFADFLPLFPKQLRVAKRIYSL